MAIDAKNPNRERRLRPGARLAAVVSEYHSELTEAMLTSARRELVSAGLGEGDLLVVRVPGAFELALVARRLARRPDVEAVLCLGLVLTGETTHDRYVAQGAARGIAQASLETDKPILFGVLTCQTIEQARARALPAQEGGKHDKGREVARAAIDVLSALDEAGLGEAESVGARSGRT